MGPSLSLAFFMGIAGVFNPCGIALLPASLAWIGGTAHTTSHPWRRLGVGGAAGLAMAVGFTVVVAILGVAVHVAGAVLTPIFHPAMIVLGGALVLGGVLVALGLFHFPLDRWLPLERIPRGRMGWSWVVAGMVYGIAALSCTLPLFVAAFVPALTAGTGAFLRLLLAFGAGIAVVMVSASEVLLLARDSALRAIRGIGPWLNPLLGLLVAGAGVYLLYYWIWGAGRYLA